MLTTHFVGRGTTYAISSTELCELLLFNMSESNYLPTGNQHPYVQPCKWKSRGAGCSGRTTDWAPVGSGSAMLCGTAPFGDCHTQSKCLSDYEQSDCSSGSRIDSGVCMSYNSGISSFDNMSSILEDAQPIPDMSHLHIATEPVTVTVNVRVYDEGMVIHDSGSFCKDTICDSIDEGLGSEVCTSVDSIPSSVPYPSNPEYDQCERFQPNEDGDT